MSATVNKTTLKSDLRMARVLDIVTVAFALFFFGFGAMAIMLKWSQDDFRRDMVLAGALGTLLVVGAIHFLKTRIRMKPERPQLPQETDPDEVELGKFKRDIKKPLLVLSLLAWQFAILWATRNVEVMNDPFFLHSFAASLSEKTGLFDPSLQVHNSFAESYLNVSPNNALYVIIFVWIQNIAQLVHLPFWFVAGIINTALIDLTLLILFRIARALQRESRPLKKLKRKDNPKTSRRYSKYEKGSLLEVARQMARVTLDFAPMLFIILIATAPLIRVFYSDTLSMFAVSAILFVMLRFHQQHRPYQVALLGLMFGLGFLIKPTVLILFIAVVLVALLWNFRRLVNALRYFKRPVFAVCGVCSVVLFAVPVFFGYKICVPLAASITPGVNTEAVANFEDKEMGMDHMMLMAMQPDSPTYQYFNPRIREWATSVDDPKLRAQLTKEKIGETLQVLDAEYPGGVVGFLKDKLAFNLGDGTFLYYYYSTSEQARLLGFAPNTKPMTGIVDSTNIVYHNYYRNFIEGAWLLVLIGGVVFCCISLWRLIVTKKRLKLRKLKRKLLSNINRVMLLSFSGLQMFLVLFEAKPRYELVMMVPILLLSSQGFDRVCGIIPKCWRALKSRKSDDVAVKNREVKVG